MLFTFIPRLLPFLVFFLFTTRVMAAEIVVVEAAPLKVFEEFQHAFLAEIIATVPSLGPKQLLSYQAEIVYLSDLAEVNDLYAAINKFSPQLIVAIGQKAFEQAARSENTPLLHALVAEPVRLPTQRADVSGLSLDVSAARQLQLFNQAFSFKRVGVIYSAKHGAVFAEQAQRAAAENGIEMVSTVIDHVKEAPAAIKGMENKIDALWLIPDTTVLTPATMEYLAFFSMEKRIPIFSFSENLLKYGATAAVSYEIEDLGRQAAHMALKILSGTPASVIDVEEPAKIQLKINRTIVDKLGITLKESFRQVLPEEHQ